jgi:hypothetical protein
MRARTKEDDGPRNWVYKRAMQRPQKSGHYRQRVTMYAVIPSTWKSDQKPSNAIILETRATKGLQIASGANIEHVNFNVDVFADPSNDVLVMFHGYGSNGSIALRSGKWYKVVAMASMYAKVAGEVYVKVAGTSNPATFTEHQAKVRENTKRNKIALVRIGRPEGWAEFEKLVQTCLEGGK